MKEHGLFSSRDTLEEALEYSQSLISARIPAEYRMEALTALHVSTNTAIKLLASASNAETIPLTEDEIRTLADTLPENIHDISPELRRRLIRYMIPKLTAIAHLLAREKHPLEASIGSFCVLAALEFGIDNESLIKETRKAEILILKSMLAKIVATAFKPHD